jgi:hypothetical protein
MFTPNRPMEDSLKINFEELDEPTPASKTLIEKLKSSAKTPVFQRIIPWALVLLVTLATLVRALGNTSSGPSTQTGIPPLEVLVTMVPLQKGSHVTTETLKLIPLKRSDLTPRQRLDCLTSDQLTELKFPLKAKKNIPPHGILFWKDLEIEFPKKTKNSGSSRTQIIFSDSKQAQQ